MNEFNEEICINNDHEENLYIDTNESLRKDLLNINNECLNKNIQEEFLHNENGNGNNENVEKSNIENKNFTKFSLKNVNNLSEPELESKDKLRKNEKKFIQIQNLNSNIKNKSEESCIDYKKAFIIVDIMSFHFHFIDKKNIYNLDFIIKRINRFIKCCNNNGISSDRIEFLFDTYIKTVENANRYFNKLEKIISCERDVLLTKHSRIISSYLEKQKLKCRFVSGDFESIIFKIYMNSIHKKENVELYIGNNNDKAEIESNIIFVSNNHMLYDKNNFEIFDILTIKQLMNFKAFTFKYLLNDKIEFVLNNEINEIFAITLTNLLNQELSYKISEHKSIINKKSKLEHLRKNQYENDSKIKIVNTSLKPNENTSYNKNVEKYNSNCENDKNFSFNFELKYEKELKKCSFTNYNLSLFDFISSTDNKCIVSTLIYKPKENDLLNLMDFFNSYCIENIIKELLYNFSKKMLETEKVDMNYYYLIFYKRKSTFVRNVFSINDKTKFSISTKSSEFLIRNKNPDYVFDYYKKTFVPMCNDTNYEDYINENNEMYFNLKISICEIFSCLYDLNFFDVFKKFFIR